MANRESSLIEKVLKIIKGFLKKFNSGKTSQGTENCKKDETVDATVSPLEIDAKKLVETIQSNSIKIPEMEITKTTIDNVVMVGKNLTLKIPQTFRIGYVVLSDEKVKKPIVSDMISLEIGDIVLIMTYKLKHHGLCISKYEITDIQSENHAIFLEAEKNINHSDQIQSLNLPNEAKREISNYFALVRR